jgi:hypothetical protein
MYLCLIVISLVNEMVKALFKKKSFLNKKKQSTFADSLFALLTKLPISESNV